MRVLAAIHDLMFSSKVNAAARGKKIGWVPRGADVAAEVAKDKPDVLLIDLASQKFDAVAAVKAIKSGESKGTTVIGYVDHTREDLIDAARAAGCDQVMSKGEFARRLPELLDGI
jgi:AmiR/NasT family two-component response regulator